MEGSQAELDLKALESFLIGNRDLERLEALLDRFNILEALGVVRQELRHSDFLRFLLCKRLGLPGTTRFHDLRHTAATIWLLKGVHPKIVQEALGHSTITITLDTYSHVLPNMQDRAMEAMREMLEPHNKSTTVS